MTVPLVTTEEVAERFRKRPSTVRYWGHPGIGAAGIRIGRRVLRRAPQLAGARRRCPSSSRSHPFFGQS
jgi:hypothetical protein